MNNPNNRRTKRKRDDPENIAEKIEKELIEKQKMLSNWTPKTELGKKVQQEKIISMDEVIEKSYKIREPEIVDSLLKLEDEIVDTAKTTRVVRAGRKYSFRVTVLTGNKDGYVGVGIGKDTDRFPAIEKAKRQARLNLKKIYKGSGSWEEQPTEDKHSVPFKVIGRSGSVTVTLLPAPKGTGLTVGKNIRRVMELAGIQNVWGKAKGNSGNKLNFVKAAVNALEQTGKIKRTKDIEKKIN
jgi:small subunit ribosomal protein S5